MTEEKPNALKNLLRTGFAYGTQFASDKLFGAAPASNEALQYEKVKRGQINGSGPVNARASLLAPSTWTEFFFGSRSGAGVDGSPGAQKAAASPAGVVILAVVSGLILFWIIKRK